MKTKELTGEADFCFSLYSNCQCCLKNTYTTTIFLNSPEEAHPLVLTTELKE